MNFNVTGVCSKGSYSVQNFGNLANSRGGFQTLDFFKTSVWETNAVDLTAGIQKMKTSFF